MEKITKTTRDFFRMCAAISFSGFTEMAPTLTPLAPAAFFALAIATAFFERLPEALPHTAAITLAILVGLVAAGGLEAAGFMAFHSAIEAHHHGAGWRAAILPGLYLVIGITALWVVEETTTATIGTALFLLAATVYAARMVMHDAKHKSKTAADAAQRQAAEEAKQKAQQQEEAQRDKEFERQQIAADKEAERVRLQIKAEAEAAAKLARIEAKARQVSTETKAKAQPKPAKLDELSGKALEIYHVLSGNPSATNTEVSETVGVSRQYVGQIRKELNGSINGATP